MNINWKPIQIVLLAALVLTPLALAGDSKPLTPPSVLLPSGGGTAVFKCFVQKQDGTSTERWLPTTAWSLLATQAGKAEPIETVVRPPTAIKVTVVDSKAEGFSPGDALVIYRTSETPWFVGKVDGKPTAPILSPAGLTATGWTY